MLEKQTNYHGSSKTATAVREEILRRYGQSEADLYDPNINARPFSSWLELGYRVKKGEKAIKSMTIIEKKDVQNNTVKKYPKTVCLFYYLQVEKI